MYMIAYKKIARPREPTNKPIDKINLIWLLDGLNISSDAAPADAIVIMCAIANIDKCTNNLFIFITQSYRNTPGWCKKMLNSFPYKR